MIQRETYYDIMKSTNFEFLREKYPELANLGGFAEQYAYSDPSSALVKLRTFAEAMVSALFAHHEINRPYQDNLYDLLNDHSFQQATPRVVIDKLHILRVNGNKAAHGLSSNISKEKSIPLIREAFSLAQWLYISFAGGSKDSCPEFCQISEETDDKGTLTREKRVALEQLAAQEAQMAQLIAELEATRRKARSTEKSDAELQFLLKESQQVADVLQFSEEETRYQLIDQQLADVGWLVGERGTDTATVKQEMIVEHQPTPTGTGAVDYVLWDPDTELPLAVIEAKKTSEDLNKGKHQAQYYADGLEKMYGQRPVIFCTNGFEISIWDDAKGEPPRRVNSFYSSASLRSCISRTKERLPLDEIIQNEKIITRMYQFEAVTKIRERLGNRHRNGLLVMATGTGKTRVAVALCDLLIQAGWVKRILFLCDRRELRKQAHNVFKEYIPTESLTYLSASNAGDLSQRICIATYPAMMKCFHCFDVGYFDLVIADESHRSIYNRYRPLLEYFDAYRIGLTATPVKFIYRNTYRLFGCEIDDPTFNYSYEDAITSEPPYLAHFDVAKVTTKFLRQGIHYKELDREQREQLEEQVEDAEDFDVEREALGSKVHNKDTDRKILQNLMENGIRDADGQNLGKTIVFARNHKHAVLFDELFDELYPQYGGSFCAVIDNYDPRAEQLIDDFKGEGQRKGHDITIAISVDMLDTGVDIPAVVNLVFAKPVKSIVKFWQMIGRGTRLCKNLFGPGKDKKSFMIFDHWGNFEYFDEVYREVEPPRTISLTQSVFEKRIELAEAAVEKQNFTVFDLAAELLEKDLKALPETTLAVREKWREKRSVERKEILKAFTPATKAVLRRDMAPLMQWRNLEGHEPAYRFDRLIANMQVALLKGSAKFDDYKATCLEQLTQLPLTLVQVQEKRPIIEKVKQAQFWDNVTVPELDKLRCDLRGIMRHRTKTVYPMPEPTYLDVRDGGVEYHIHKVKLEGRDLVAYRFRVEKVLKDMFEQSPTLQKIKKAQAVTEAELDSLAQQIELLDPELNINDLLDNFSGKTGRLDVALRHIVGMDAASVDEVFLSFLQKYPQMSSHQIRFLNMLKGYISRYGAIEVEKLWEAPFTTIDAMGLDGVFPDPIQARDLISTLEVLRVA